MRDWSSISTQVGSLFSIIETQVGGTIAGGITVGEAGVAVGAGIGGYIGNQLEDLFGNLGCPFFQSNSSGNNSNQGASGSSPLPRDKDGNPIPSSDYPHTQLGEKKGRKGAYRQTREWGENGKLVKDIDWTNHGRLQDHPDPHQHRWLQNPTGGTPQRGPTEPLQ